MTDPKKKLVVYDTTLRDGNQAVGIGFSLNDKLLIAEKLSELGVHYIEGGWPNPTNSLDIDFYKKIPKSLGKTKIAVFGSTRRPHCTCGSDDFFRMLIKSETPVATIFGKTWDLHVKKVIRASLEENCAMIAESVAYLKKYKDEVIYDAEHFFDGFTHNPEYALKTITAAAQAGADCIVLCDTNGGMLPQALTDIFRSVAAKVTIPLGIHTHNDSGCAEANTILAVAAGAVHIQGTINGLGERCGNANLCTIIAGLQLKQGFKILPEAQLKMLSPVSVFVNEIANIAHNIRQPYVGEAAFSHKAGAHADGVIKTNESFEHVRPESVGNTRRFVVSAQAGSSTIMKKLAPIVGNLDKKDPRVKSLLVRIKSLESQGYQFEAADGSFEILAREMLGLFKKPFEVVGFRIIEDQLQSGNIVSEATIKIAEGAQIEHTAAEGDGPVNALDNALRKALVKFYPGLKEVKLEDFKVRVLDGSEGTGAKVRVLIESSDGADLWGTVGVSTNIIQASWIAMIDSIKYKLMKDALQGKKDLTGRRRGPKGRAL
ncbi:MAG: citramalate synthase [Chitinivibrionales bacterium]|nr:citramalate synthase [Chitinivibrionales bacterium]